MNANNFTQKSLEALQGAQTAAQRHGNQQIEQSHLMLALLDQEGGLIPQLLTRMEITVPSFRAAVQAEVERLPKVSGSGREAGKLYISAGTDKAINAATDAAVAMKDEYVSVEHLLLGLLEMGRGNLRNLLETYRITKEDALKALETLTMFIEGV